MKKKQGNEKINAKRALVHEGHDQPCDIIAASVASFSWLSWGPTFPEHAVQVRDGSALCLRVRAFTRPHISCTAPFTVCSEEQVATDSRVLTVPSDWSVLRSTEHKRMKCKILLLKTWSSTQASRHVNETKKDLQTNVLGEFFHYGASESTELWILICDRIGDCLVSGTRN